MKGRDEKDCTLSFSLVKPRNVGSRDFWSSGLAERLAGRGDGHLHFCSDAWIGAIDLGAFGVSRSGLSGRSPQAWDSALIRNSLVYSGVGRTLLAWGDTPGFGLCRDLCRQYSLGVVGKSLLENQYSINAL